MERVHHLLQRVLSIPHFLCFWTVRNRLRKVGYFGSDPLGTICCRLRWLCR